MKGNRSHIIHICGCAGMNFVLWLKKRLEEQHTNVVIVDCSEKKSFIMAITKIRKNISGIFSGEDWEVRFKNSGVIIMYHEENDRFTDSYEGMYIMFTTRYRLEYTLNLVKELSSGRLCLFEHTLVPQLACGKNIYVLVMRNHQAEGEYFIPSHILDIIPGPYETHLIEIMTKNVLMYLKY